jgi:ketosteroid isomerase-like protein
VSATPELLALVRQGFECWNTGELDLMQGMYSPDAEIDFSAAFPDGGLIRGRQEIRRFWDEAWEAWEGFRMDPIDVIELDGERFVVPVRLWGKGRGSGIEIDQRFACLYTFGDDGLVVRNELFLDTDAALAAANAVA